MNKKAIVAQKIGPIVIGLVVLILIIFFLIRVRTATINIVENSECKNSIDQHALLLKVSKEALVPDIYCPTKYYTLSSSDEEEVKHDIAKALKTCWGTWGKGELNLFTEEGYYCHICSVVDFKGKTKKIPGLGEYLIKTPVELGSELTYVDFLTGFSSEKADPELINEIQSKSFSGSIDTSKAYAAIFVYAKGKKAVKEFLDNANLLGFGTAGGGVSVGLGVGAVVVATVATVSTAGISIVAAGVVVAAGGIAGGIIGLVTADDVEWTAFNLFLEYNAENLKKIGCDISYAKQDTEKDELG